MRVALCCKEGLFCEALASLLDHHGSFQVVANETSARSLINAAKDQRAQLLVVDSFDLDRDDLQFLLGARAFGDFAIVLIVGENEKGSFTEVPVDRLVSRQSPAERLFDSLGELSGKVRLTSRPYVREGRRPYGMGPANDHELSRREYEVAQLVAKGMSNRKIAAVTGLREQSIKNLVSVIMRKLRCENRVQVALKLTQGSSMSEEVKPVEAGGE
jgi:DNA-binding NarL/FixJ family response regulator